MGMVLKTNAAKSPWEWIADNLHEHRGKLRFAVVADGATAYGIKVAMRRCGIKAVSSPFYAMMFDGTAEAKIHAVDSSNPGWRGDLSSLELDGAVVGADVPWNVVMRVRERIGRTKNRIDLGCYVTDEMFCDDLPEVHQDYIDVLLYGVNSCFHCRPCEKHDFAITRKWFDDQFFADISKIVKSSSCDDGFGSRKRMSYEDLVKMTLDMWKEWFSQGDK